MNVFDIVTIERHRFYTDGKGITTLVILNGCPLKCRYCINEKLLSDAKTEKLTADELMGRLMQDYCYFAATGGGAAFGGGEPLLHAEALLAFIGQVKGLFATTIETSLCLEADVIALLKAADRFIIDVKSIDSAVYRAYTGTDNAVLLSNLEKISRAGLQHKCVVRIPDIKNYTTQKEIDKSVHYVRSMGFEEIDRFSYQIRPGDARSPRHRR